MRALFCFAPPSVRGAICNCLLIADNSIHKTRTLHENVHCTIFNMDGYELSLFKAKWSCLLQLVTNAHSLCYAQPKLVPQHLFNTRARHAIMLAARGTWRRCSAQKCLFVLSTFCLPFPSIQLRARSTLNVRHGQKREKRRYVSFQRVCEIQESR